MNYAVIDLGSNTIRLSIYQYEGGKIMTVIKQKEVAGLAGYIKKNRLELDGIQKACEILTNFRELAMRFVDDEHDIHVFATASLRGVANQNQALDMIQQSSGLLPVVLSGEEEARLDFIGVTSHFSDLKDGLLIDIGGASTELIRFEDAEPVQLVSMPIGCLNLYTKFVGEVIPTDNERKRIKKEILDKLNKLKWDTDRIPDLMIGVGGTVRAARKLSRELFSLPKDQKEMNAAYIKKILERIRDNKDDIYLTINKVIPERTSTIYTGLMILNEAIKKFRCESILVSDYGIREGYLVDKVLKEGGAVHVDEDSEHSGLHVQQGAFMA